SPINLLSHGLAAIQRSNKILLSKLRFLREVDDLEALEVGLELTVDV
ncbi:hypothetical protein A2U01_0035922, partial [Trifolium medium]|nr:hypothetical protein [Trifolium medium]